MKFNLMRHALFLVLLFLPLTSYAQTELKTNEQIVQKSMASVVLVLTGKGDGILDKVGSGVVVRSDGVIFTAYHVVKNATQVQIRLINGEIFDKVDLLAFDERRDIAALKIPAADLPTAELRSDEPTIGGRVFVISNPNGLSWTVADGLLSSFRLADEIPNAGRGFRVIQFSAPVSAGSSGGLLTDENGLAVGLIVSSVSTGQNLNFAIPVASVKGLMDTTQKTMSFGRASSLELPQAVRPPTSIDVVNADPTNILKNARLVFITSDSVLISEKMMENGLMKRPEFKKWKLAIINDRKNADLLINVEHQLFTFDYRFTMTDFKTGIVLATGKVTVWDGQIASRKFAAQIVKKLAEAKEPKN